MISFDLEGRKGVTIPKYWLRNMWTTRNLKATRELCEMHIKIWYWLTGHVDIFTDFERWIWFLSFCGWKFKFHGTGSILAIHITKCSWEYLLDDSPNPLSGKNCLFVVVELLHLPPTPFSPSPYPKFILSIRRMEQMIQFSNTHVSSVVHSLILLIVISACLSLFACLLVNGGLPALTTLWTVYTVYCTSRTSERTQWNR